MHHPARRSVIGDEQERTRAEGLPLNHEFDEPSRVKPSTRGSKRGSIRVILGDHRVKIGVNGPPLLRLRRLADNEDVIHRRHRGRGRHRCRNRRPSGHNRDRWRVRRRGSNYLRHHRDGHGRRWNRCRRHRGTRRSSRSRHRGGEPGWAADRDRVGLRRHAGLVVPNLNDEVPQTLGQQPDDLLYLALLGYDRVRAADDQQDPLIPRRDTEDGVGEQTEAQPRPVHPDPGRDRLNDVPGRQRYRAGRQVVLPRRCRIAKRDQRCGGPVRMEAAPAAPAAITMAAGVHVQQALADQQDRAVRGRHIDTEPAREQPGRRARVRYASARQHQADPRHPVGEERADRRGDEVRQIRRTEPDREIDNHGYPRGFRRQSPQERLDQSLGEQ